MWNIIKANNIQYYLIDDKGMENQLIDNASRKIY